jgi:transposase InsO family protein
MCENYGIRAQPTASHYPQANAIIERVQKEVNEMLRSFDLDTEELEVDSPFDSFLQSAVRTMRRAFHRRLHASLCQLVFGRDMIHNVAFRPDWDWIRRHKQQQINKLNEKEKESCLPYEYKLEIKYWSLCQEYSGS